jgi:hypothetical protein
VTLTVANTEKPPFHDESCTRIYNVNVGALAPLIASAMMTLLLLALEALGRLGRVAGGWDV